MARNPFDPALERVVGRMSSFSKKADLAKTVPLGMERVSNQTFRNRFEQMNEQEKRDTIARMGLPELMKALGA